MISNPHGDSVVQGDDGIIRVGGTRVTLDTVVNAFNKGMSAEEIVMAYTALSLADVYHAIAYYLYHRDEINNYLLERQNRAEVVKREVEARHPDMVGIRERLLSRLESK